MKKILDSVAKAPTKETPAKKAPAKEKAPAKKEKAPAKKKPSITLPKAAQDIVNTHNLKDEDAAEVKAQAKSLADKSSKSRMTPQERKKKFLDNIDPSKYSPKELKAMKERISKMPPNDFEKMVFSLADEGDMGKTATWDDAEIVSVEAEQADPESHDQNLPSHWYFKNKTAARLRRILAEEGILKEIKEQADPKSHDQNLPSHYYYGKKATGKVAAGPDPRGRNWKESNTAGRKSWYWGKTGEMLFIVAEFEASFGKYYKLSVMLEDGTNLQTVGQKLEPDLWFKRAAQIYKESQTVFLDFSNQPELWKRI